MPNECAGCIGTNLYTDRDPSCVYIRVILTANFASERSGQFYANILIVIVNPM